jgi:hypothetical protein
MLVTKAADTRLEYVIFIAFPRLQCLHKYVSLLCYTYIPCLVVFLKDHPFIRRRNLFVNTHYDKAIHPKVRTTGHRGTVNLTVGTVK